MKIKIFASLLMKNIIILAKVIEFNYLNRFKLGNFV